ncbi:hypothetical protein MPC4_450013 [Methylocella tundrae]|uniref:Uncharacterized protein n=1 Tax=Methylocella tundrae TaxID=227605 RepID=A0A8B6M9X0_METTU|nr:hypothetical protein MPC4_450013 [Methylocella tundrae]
MRHGGGDYGEEAARTVVTVAEGAPAVSRVITRGETDLLVLCAVLGAGERGAVAIDAIYGVRQRDAGCAANSIRGSPQSTDRSGHNRHHAGQLLVTPGETVDCVGGGARKVMINGSHEDKWKTRGAGIKPRRTLRAGRQPVR